jgi:uncharacterized iron-regulated membrane protein
MSTKKSLTRTIHLWAGLVFGTLLVLQGLTGSILSWRHELDALLNPGLLQVAPPPGTRQGEPLRVAPAMVQAVSAMLTADKSFGRPSMLMLPEHGGDVFIAWYRPGKSASIWQQGITRQVMVDPASLQVLGERNWGEAGLARPLLLPTLFHLHHYLLAGEGGKVVVAVEGLALLLLAVTGIIVWWPKLTRSALWHALTFRFGIAWPKLSFQLHRAAGFYIAPVFLLLALSGVYFNKPAWVTPAVGALATLTPNDKPANRSAPASAALAPARAVAAAQALFPEGRVSRLSFPARAGQPYEVRVRQPGEMRHGDGATRITIDSGDGAILRVVDPLRMQSGDRFLSWMFPLHTGEALGTAGRVFISFVGLMPLVFFVTGLVMWIKFRRPKAKPRRSETVAPARDSVAASLHG